MHDITERGSLAREARQFSFDSVEMRDDGEGTLTFDGIASVVDTPYAVRDSFGEFEETMVRGAFTKTLKEKDDVRLLVNHDGIPLARTKSKTLTLTEGPHLRAVAPLDASSPLVQTIRSAMNRGDMDQMSIGFRVTRQEWNEDYTERAIREVQLLDVSLVTFPASPTTSASLRFDDAVKALTADDVDPAEIQRAIDYLMTLLPEEEREEEPPAAIDLDLLREFWDKRLPA